MEDKDSQKENTRIASRKSGKQLQKKGFQSEAETAAPPSQPLPNGVERRQSDQFGLKSPEKIPSKQSASAAQCQSRRPQGDARPAAWDKQAERAIAAPNASPSGATSCPENAEDDAAVDTGRYQGGEVATRLKTARIAAGFASAGAAATQHGWGVSLYQHQESGNRAFTASDVERFAAAFNVPARWIVTGEGAEDRRLTETIQKASEERSRQSRASASRLRFCRLVRGFRSVASAAERFGLKRSTLSNHELGATDFSAEWASVYGLAFGVRPEWLVTGTMPSGLGAGVDSYLERVQLKDSEDAKAHADALRHVGVSPVIADRAAIAQALENLEAASRNGVPLSKRRPPATVMIPEVPLASFAAAEISVSVGKSLEEAKRRPARTWGFPMDYLESALKADAHDLVVVAFGASSSPDTSGERYVVNTAAPILAEAGTFVLKSPTDRLLVRRLDAGDRSLGDSLTAEDREEAATLVGRLVMRMFQVE